MIKRLKQYFKSRRELRLRKWCIEKASKVCNSGEDIAYTADYIYNWVTGQKKSDL